ncbi:MAG: DUF596 domain-containing protein [Oxalobacteraceae bacterium]|nr:DUF596 domain-containing protein [Oxalobacteraceae bacterium]
MNSIFSDKLYEVTFPKVTEGNLVDFWLATHYDEDNKDIEEIINFSDRREIFLWVLERLLREGRVKLHKNGIFLKSSIEDQVELFKKSWPESEEASGYEDFYWWFFDPECPAGIAWRKDDGSYEIAD